MSPSKSSKTVIQCGSPAKCDQTPAISLPPQSLVERLCVALLFRNGQVNTMHKHYALVLLVWWRIERILSLVFIAWSAVAYAVSEIFIRYVKRASHPICLIRKSWTIFARDILPRQREVFRQRSAIGPHIHAPDVFQVEPHAGAFATLCHEPLLFFFRKTSRSSPLPSATPSNSR